MLSRSELLERSYRDLFEGSPFALFEMLAADRCVEIWSHLEDQLACDAFWRECREAVAAKKKRH